MKKQIKQTLSPINADYPYQVAVTSPKYGKSQGLEVQYTYNNYEDAMRSFEERVMDNAKHLTMVDTYRIIGVYYRNEMLKQVKIVGIN